MSQKVFLTVRSDAKRIPGQVVHYAIVHDLNDRLMVSATLDYVLAVAQERGFEFVGENPAELRRAEEATERRLEQEREARERNWDAEAEQHAYAVSVEA